MVSIDEHADPACGVIVLRPNQSARWALNKIMIAIMLVIQVAVAAGFMLLGGWPIPLFAGLEVLLFAVGLYWVYLKTCQIQRITLSRDQVVIEKGRHRPEKRWEFRRIWTKVAIGAAGNEFHVPRVHIYDNQQSAEIGEFLNRADKLLLIKQLKRMVGYF